MMVQYSHTDNTDDDSSDDDETNDGSVFTHWWWPVDDSEDDVDQWMIQKMTTIDVPEDDKKNIEEIWLQKKIKLRSMMNMYDVVPKIPMTYRVSPASYIVVIVAVSTTVEYLPNQEGVLK